MTNTFGNYISSPLFTFEIGEEKQTFTVHSEPLAKLSQPLQNLITGGMIEAETRRVVWPDIDQDTFFRLCEFAYLGDYTPPTYSKINIGHKKKGKRNKRKAVLVNDGPPHQPPSQSGEESNLPEEPEAVEVLEAAEQPPPPDDCLGWDEPPPVIPPRSLRKTRKEKTISEIDLRKSFLCLKLEPNPRPTSQFTPRGNSTANQDFTPVFLGHVALWVLADRYQIDLLCSLVINKLHQTLQEFTLYETSVKAIIQLVIFTYSNTRSPERGTNGLRSLVTCYIASVVGMIGDDEEFRKLLADGGEFVMDFWNAIWVNNE